eukprot:2054651-Alexandrium_andersonii.AAC.1
MLLLLLLPPPPLLLLSEVQPKRASKNGPPLMSARCPGPRCGALGTATSTHHRHGSPSKSHEDTLAPASV